MVSSDVKQGGESASIAPLFGTRQVRSNTGIDRRSFAHIPTVLEMPELIEVQLTSFKWFVEQGLRELLEEISPITDHHQKMALYISEPRFDEPYTRMPKGDMRDRAERDSRVAEQYCRERDITYAAPLRVKARLEMRETGEIKETGDEGIFLGDFPWMTKDGTFVINGAERVVVSQLVRSPGVYFESDRDPVTNKQVASAKLIPNRGAWLEFEISNRDVISVKVDRKRKMPVTILLRAVGIDTNEKLRAFFEDVDTDPDRHYLQSTIDKESGHPNRDRSGEREDPRWHELDSARGVDGALSPSAPGRSAEPGKRATAIGELLLQRASLRSCARRSLQAQRPLAP